MRRVVITGLGIYSCIGNKLDEVRNSLYSGKSGIIYDPVRKSMGFRSSLTGQVERPKLKGLIDRRLRVGMGQPAEFAYMATKEALDLAKLDPDYLTANDAGILFGNDSVAQATIESVDRMRETKDTTMLGSGSIFQSMNSTVTMNLSVIFKLKGINFTLSGACASGSHSIGIGFFLVKHGYQNCIICGGAQEVNPYSMGSFDGLSAFSIQENEPERASRPFDRDRDGLIPSGGAATVIIEDYESAKKRDADIFGEIVAYGFSSNGVHISQPNVEGSVKAIEMSLKQAELRASEIDYINAHATSTLLGDKYEAKALNDVFGKLKPYVSSTKSMTGHECWMAGASEIVYSMIMMNNSFIAPNINFENPDKDSSKLNIATKTIDTNINYLLSNSFGFGGTNSSLIIKKFK